MFDLQLSQLPLLCPAHAFKESCSQNFIFLGEKINQKDSAQQIFKWLNRRSLAGWTKAEPTKWNYSTFCGLYGTTSYP